MAEHHEPGTMDITEQEKTFEGFLRVCAAVIVVSLLTLIVLAFFRT
ncbi:MAG TPA: aa3-type cytochrome c oxidase subunit IV [Thermohalobaculum sp.]|nr:aa3-type cytochrome c oxidase subunit IV [Thermohalobaculum sp.]